MCSKPLHVLYMYVELNGTRNAHNSAINAQQRVKGFDEKLRSNNINKVDKTSDLFDENGGFDQTYQTCTFY